MWKNISVYFYNLILDKGILQIADFGLARSLGIPKKPSTPKVVTLWYRAPEVLFGAKIHSSAMDLWSAGWDLDPKAISWYKMIVKYYLSCVLAELLLHAPLFAARSELELIDLIINTIGSPSEQIWPGYSELPLIKDLTLKHQPYSNLKSKFPWWNSDSGYRLLNGMLYYCPQKRINAADAVRHQYFQG